MNNVCLCVGKYAGNPFYVKFLDISLYSMEELCYYFMESVHMLDDRIVSVELVKWIRNECGLSALADELDVYVRKKVSVAVFVTAILEKTGVCDAGTVKMIEHVLKEQSSLDMAQRYRKRAEYLYNQGRFRQAFSIYAWLADHIPYEDFAQRALMYHNMASIYAMDFAYKEAAEYYYKAYLINQDARTKISYILAKKMALSDYGFGCFKRENPKWEQDFERAEEMFLEVSDKWERSEEKKLVDEIAELKSSINREEYHKRKGELTWQLKTDYRRQTKG